MDMIEDSILLHDAERDKQRVALSSVLAAVFLTGMKLFIGLVTGSLGILAEAAHSGLDLMAAIMTYFAVRLSGRPADQFHTYGYGKVENLSALFETLLLLLTCVWIIYEAVLRLFYKSVEVEASLWAFLVMLVSIGVDLGRSRALARAARLYDSQALEADALHFSTDIWSSSVVIAGLLLVRMAGWLEVGWLAKADAVAAMGVAVIVAYVSLRLGRRTLSALVDAVPAGVRDEVVRAVRVPGVLEVKRVRVRKSGPQIFSDVTLVVGSGISFEAAHEVSSNAEKAVHRILPGADVIVYVVPDRFEDRGLLDTIRSLAAKHALGTHGVRIYDEGGGRLLELHLEVSDLLTLEEAHAQASAFEEELRQTLPEIDQVVTHIEPTGDSTATRQATLADEIRVLQILEGMPAEIGVVCQPHDLRVHRVGGELLLSFHCTMGQAVSIASAHSITEQVERYLRTRMPELGRVVIHTEPDDGETT